MRDRLPLPLPLLDLKPKPPPTPRGGDRSAITDAKLPTPAASCEASDVRALLSSAKLCRLLAMSSDTSDAAPLPLLLLLAVRSKLRLRLGLVVLAVRPLS